MNMDIQRSNLANFTFKQTYAKYLPSKRRRENWGESVDRLMNMHASKFIDNIEIFEDLNEIEDSLKRKDILGSQRSLQFGGKAILDKPWRIFNCTTSFCDRPRFFAESLWLLLCGCGVGYSVQKHHVSKLPPVISSDQINNAQMRVVMIKDTIEGWADALDALIQFYLGQSDTMPIFNYSLIRKKGAPLSHGGKAPGPVPLKFSLQMIEKILVSRAGMNLRSIDCLDIVCVASDCVLSGGVRRSATIAIFSMDDSDMWTAKTGNWWKDAPYRARANISAVALKNKLDKQDFMKKFLDNVPQWGEPGFVFTESTEFCFNPCVSGRTRILTAEGYKTAKQLFDAQQKTSLRIDPRFKQGTYSESTDKGVFSTGIQDVYRLQTKQGYFVECTNNHQIMTSRGWIEAGALVKGDKIHIFANSESAINQQLANISLDEYNKGLVLGWWSGDGSYDANTNLLYFYGAKRQLAPLFSSILDDAKIYSNDKVDRDTIYIPSTLFPVVTKETRKQVPAEVYSSLSCRKGYLSALFGADGSVQGSLSKKGASIRLTQNNLEFLEEIQQMLLEFSIYSKIYKNRRKEGVALLPDGKGGQDYYSVKAVHELIIANESIDTFYRLLSILHPEKQSDLEDIVMSRKRKANKEHFEADFESLSFVAKEEVYDLTENKTHSFIANGVVVHNCVEISMCPMLIKDKDGHIVDEYTLDLINPENRTKYEDQGYTFESGWQACNLTEVNASKFKDFSIDSIDAFYIAVKNAVKLGTLQASYTKSDYLGPVSEQIVEREALLGVSLTGLANSAFFFKHEDDRASFLLKSLAEFAIVINKQFSKKIGIKPAARITCVKPSGTASVILGCASGIHPEHARRFLRHVQVPADSALVQKFEELNPQAVKNSVWAANGTDKCLIFAVECNPENVFKNDLKATEFLSLVKMVYNSWVKNGNARPKSLEGSDHNVSNTCNVRPNEWEQAGEFVFDNQEYFCGVSFLSMSGDYDYQQPPFKAVYDHIENQNMYFDEVEQIEHEYLEHKDEDRYKSALSFALNRKQERAEAFDLWVSLRSSNAVDFDSVLEGTDETTQAQELACAGGACII